jgi:hypothetical protein
VKEIAAQQLGIVGGQGNPGEQPQPLACGITDAAKRQLDRYSNPSVKKFVLDVVDRKRGGGVSMNRV